MRKIRLQYQRIHWFFKQVWVLWRWKNKLGLDGNWPTVLLKPHTKGQWVHDGLTRLKTTVIGVEYAEGFTNPGQTNNPNQIGCWGIYVNSQYLGGARHPWEVSSLK